MTGFDIFDRYDFVMYLAIGLVAVAALILGAPLWALVPIYASGCVLGFIRHFDEVMYGESRKVTPEAPDPNSPDTPTGAVSGLDRKPMQGLAMAHPQKPASGRSEQQVLKPHDR